jgi:hypothetical protein
MDYREKTQTENQQLFDGIIDDTLFDRAGGLEMSLTNITVATSVFVSFKQF